MTPFPWKQGDEADEGVVAFSPEALAMTGDAQDAEYLEPLRKALADALALRFDSQMFRDMLEPEDSEAFKLVADRIVYLLTEAGWRFVTAKDWKEMSHAWVMGALR